MTHVAVIFRCQGGELVTLASIATVVWIVLHLYVALDYSICQINQFQVTFVDPADYI